MPPCSVCSGERPEDGYELVDLPCGCQDVVYADGRICHEHDHVKCDGNITAKKMAYWAPFALDDDGTPLMNGERMVEVSPGQWMDPTFAMILDYLAKTETDGAQARHDH
jgi:hypothetical protein